MLKLDPHDLFIVVAGVADSFSLNLLASDFAASVAEGEHSILRISWAVSPSWVSNAYKELPIVLRQCRLAGKPYTLHLITFPSGIPVNFALEDLQFPFNIAGLVLAVDLSSGNGITWQDYSTKSFVRLKLGKSGGIRWTKETSLPCVIVASSIGPQIITIDEMRRRLDVLPEVPIIFYQGKTRKKSKDTCLLTYDQEYTWSILATLINQIESDNTITGLQDLR